MLALAITTAIQAMVAMAALTLPVMAPEVARVFGTSPAYIGVFVAILYAGAVFSSLGAGSAVARFGAIRTSQAGLLLCAAGLALCAVPWLPAVAAGALVLGFGYGPITPASSHLLARTTPAHRMSLVFSIKQTGVPLGGVLAGAVVPAMLLAWGWQGALLCVAGVNVLCAVLAQPLRAELDADRTSDGPRRFARLAGPLRLVWSHPALRLLAGCSFFFSMAQMTVATYLVTYLTNSLAYGLVTAGFALSVTQVGGTGGRILWGYVADRWLGPRRTLIVLAALMSASAVATTLLHAALPLPVVLAVCAVFGISAIGWNGVYLSEVARQAPAGQASAATGASLAVTFMGAVLGGPLISMLSAQAASYRAAFAAVAVFTAACGLALWRARALASPAR